MQFAAPLAGFYAWISGEEITRVLAAANGHVRDATKISSTNSMIFYTKNLS
jgi:hypothetical protein